MKSLPEHGKHSVWTAAAFRRRQSPAPAEKALRSKLPGAFPAAGKRTAQRMPALPAAGHRILQLPSEAAFPFEQRTRLAAVRRCRSRDGRGRPSPFSGIKTVKHPSHPVCVYVIQGFHPDPILCDARSFVRNRSRHRKQRKPSGQTRSARPSGRADLFDYVVGCFTRFFWPSSGHRPRC